MGAKRKSKSHEPGDGFNAMIADNAVGKTVEATECYSGIVTLRFTDGSYLEFDVSSRAEKTAVGFTR